MLSVFTCVIFLKVSEHQAFGGNIQPQLPDDYFSSATVVLNQGTSMDPQQQQHAHHMLPMPPRLSQQRLVLRGPNDGQLRMQGYNNQFMQRLHSPDGSHFSQRQQLLPGLSAEMQVNNFIDFLKLLKIVKYLFVLLLPLFKCIPT